MAVTAAVVVAGRVLRALAELAETLVTAHMAEAAAQAGPLVVQGEPVVVRPVARKLQAPALLQTAAAAAAAAQERRIRLAAMVVQVMP